MRSLILLFAAIGCLACATSSAQATVDCEHLAPDYTDDDVKAPMKFFDPESNSCSGNAVFMPTLAVGVITAETPQVFAEFAKSNSPTVLEFTSPGGNLVAGLKLGELIRKNGYSTSLGETCASACSYAAMGGIKRYFVTKSDGDVDGRFLGATGTKFGVHQFFQQDALDEPEKKTLSAKDQQGDQLLMGMLLEYTVRMGIDIRVVSAAASVPPPGIRWLTPEEMLDWNIDNTHRRYSDLALHTFGHSGIYVEQTSAMGTDESFLRIFCNDTEKEPTFAFITDRLIESELYSKGIDSGQIKRAVDSVQSLLGRLTLSLEFGSQKLPATKFKIVDVEGIKQSNNVVRVFAAIRPFGLPKQDAEGLTRVALVDDGDLSRSEQTFQDFVKFQVHGDRKLIRLAMRNCVQ